MDEPGRLESCYGSEGWGSSPSERANETPGQALPLGMSRALFRVSGSVVSQFLTALSDLVNLGERGLAALQVLVACMDVGLLGERRVVTTRPLAEIEIGTPACLLVTAAVCLLCGIPHNRHSFAVACLLRWYRDGADRPGSCSGCRPSWVMSARSPPPST